jgi:hypothetical protein
MRLTLRTLLAYLDDTLEPAKAKEIGQKVAESDAARDLVERLKQVTRRRRIAAPSPSGGASKLDPNTIAEYLDNEVSPETAAEVEAICLANDVHLAEVAACHQILTLVLGEPTSVPPPSAKQRMVGLVKGPEAIPSHKPAPAPKAKTPEGGAAARDVDDTLRLGLPGGKSGLAGKLLLIGGGVAAACLIAIAIWNLLNNSSIKDDGPKEIARVDDKDKDKEKEKEKGGDKKEPVREAGDKEKVKEEKDKEKPPTKDKDKDKEEIVKDGKKEDKREPKFLEVAFAPPDNAKPMAIGRYQSDEPKDTTVCLQLDPVRKDWKRLKNSDGEVVTGKTLMSMPGSWSSIFLPRGLRLTLCGNTPEIFGGPSPIYESKVVLHNHDELDLDLTLLRGQIILTSLKERPMQVRVRFANPFSPDRPEHYEVLFHSKGTEVMFSLFSRMPEPFFSDKDDPRRKGPVNEVVCIVLKGFVNLKFGDVGYGTGPLNLYGWSSAGGPRPPIEIPNANKALQEPPFDEKMDEKLKAFFQNNREAMKKARTNLGYLLDDGSLRIKLEGVLRSTEPSKRFDPKSTSPTKIMLARLTVRCQAALGDLTDVNSLLELLDPPMNDVVRGTAREALVDWVAQDRDNDYVLYKLLEEKYRKVQAERIMRLMHDLTVKELNEPVTYQYLIEQLDNPNPAIRELAAFRLYSAAPPPMFIPYSAADGSEERMRAMALWQAFIPSGSLPPRPKKK